MSFRISARTVLELGADLISSDDVAIYELVKNAIDAKSKTGVEIHFQIVLAYSRFVEAVSALESPGSDSIADIKEALLKRLEPGAVPEVVNPFRAAINGCSTKAVLLKRLPELYAEYNWIEFRDTGVGMSQQDLTDKFLIIGTPTRKRNVDAAELAFSKAGPEGQKKEAFAPFLGEKGVGRLSAMRLGWRLHLETATEADKQLNCLDIDWKRFEDLDLFLEDIEVLPVIGGAKTSRDWSGTDIRVSGLQNNWSPRRIREIAMHEFSKISDPFSTKKKRFRIAVFFNGERIEIPRLNEEILSAAQATVKASYTTAGRSPALDVNLTVTDASGTHEKHMRFDKVDLGFLTDDGSQEVPAYALRTVGPFELEAYWFNRQKLQRMDAIGDRHTVRELQKRWSGVMLFRDGYRVLPYGEDKDDWLGLDRKALASQGYKLNKTQFIGRVSISRLANPKLLDQTNREGLKENPEKFVFVELLRYTIQDLLRSFMTELDKRQKSQELDAEAIGEHIVRLETRAVNAIKLLKRRHKESTIELQDLLTIFEQMKNYFEQARQFASQAEDEKSRLMQLAGIGLMLEVVAHELARSTETAMASLASAQTSGLPTEVNATLKTLRAEMQTMNKRLRVLDPLSVSGRQRREKFDLPTMIREVFAGRSSQFKRHRIVVKVTTTGGTSLVVDGVKGMFVQIVENLTSNSVFWLKKRAEEDHNFEPRIDVSIDSKQLRMTFRDNGPGISKDLAQDVFRAFFSTKDRRRRQGLGLYIAQECATANGAVLSLSGETTEHKNRLNTFILQLAEQQ